MRFDEQDSLMILRIMRLALTAYNTYAAASDEINAEEQMELLRQADMAATRSSLARGQTLAAAYEARADQGVVSASAPPARPVTAQPSISAPAPQPI